ncbi:MAG: hypothetical protein U0797_10000 [Gemmataceae bacterium]
MSMTTPLPPALHRRLAGVARRVRRMRLVRGASLLVLALAGLAGGAFLADYLTRESLPGLARGAALAAWLGLGSLLLLGLARRLLRPLDAADLAAVIEKRYPELGERLTSSVELCRSADVGSGSPELIALLVQEAEARTGKLDLAAAVSGRSTGLLTGLAAATLAATLAPAALAPAKYGRLAQRFFAPWQTLAPLPEYAFDVEPGDAHAARGRPATITARLTPRDDLELPRKATLLVVGEGGTAKHDMTPDANEPARYAATFRVPGDVRYRVLAGTAGSVEYELSAVTPVDLAADSPSVMVTPPAYAASVVDAETVTGMVDLACLQHSDVTLKVRFTRPAVAATLEWTASGEKPSLTPLKLSDDRMSAEYSFRAAKSGAYRLLLDAEHGVRTERDGGAVTVRPDQVPAVLKFTGPEGVPAARPYDRVPLEARLADDIAVAGADLEYRINDDQSVREERVAVEVAREAVAKHTFALAGKVKAGDEVHYRLRYRDNLPKEFGGPHVCYHPADGWLKLRVVAEGGSLKEREILARRDAVNKKLDDVLADLKQEQRKVMGVKADTRQEAALNERDLDRVGEARKLNQQSEKALRDLARETGEEPGGDKLAQQARDVADKEMRRADQALQNAAERDARPRDRDQKFQDTVEDLNRAIAKVDQLKDENEKAAKERLAQARVESLAERQRQLAEKADELSKKGSPPESEQVKRDQDEVARDLEKLTESNPALKRALDQARAEQAKQAAEKARELAQAQRDLAKASEETEKRREAEKLAELARQQEGLAKKAEEFARETARQARANFGWPLQPDDAGKAAASLKKGESDKAVREQTASAREMDRLANELERGAEQAKDPKAAARQLARLEENLGLKLRDPEVTRSEEKLRELKRDQEAVREAASRLSLPPGNGDLQAEKQKATEGAGPGRGGLGKKDAAEAQKGVGGKGRQALRDLSAKMPSLEERRAQARKDLARLARDQEEASKLVRDLTKSPEAARKQGEVAKGLEKLDTPGAEAHRDKAREAAAKAEERLAQRDRAEGSVQQAKVKRELEQLAKSLAGQKTDDEKATDLARRQKNLVEEAAKPAPSKAKQDEMRRAQKQVADETKQLEASELGRSKAFAQYATKKAADEAAKNPSSPESKQAMDYAAQKLDELARKMGGEEAKPEPDRALPSKEQADAARKLAQQQRDLRDAVQRFGEQMRAERKADNAKKNDSTAGKVNGEQAEIARQSERLSKEVAKEQGDNSAPSRTATEANRSAGEASKSLDAGALEKARQSGEQAAEGLRKLANELAKTPRAGDAKGDTLEQARKLAQRQEAVNKQMGDGPKDTPAQRAQQQARQEELTRRAADLGRELEELSKAAPQGSRADAGDAARSARQAETTMQAAKGQARMGNQPGAQTQREMAAKSLDRAARHAEQAGKSADPSTPSGQAGQAVREARGGMDKAREAMRRNQPGEAGSWMQQAAKSLTQAAQQLGKAMEPTAPTNPGPTGAPPGGAVDERALPKELAAYSGKRWGELPGEVRTKVTQQMKARYGDDYARMIKLYFEQIADTRKRK